jgi:hypothetical protein
MVRVSGREYNGLIDSPCFANATDPGRTMSCFSCHTMHKPPEDPRPIAEWADTHQVSSGKEGDGGCLQCHGSIAANVSMHTNHRPGSTGSACYNCHMPYTTYGLLRALRSHQVSSPSVESTVQTGRPNACNGCHLDKTLQWTSDNLQQWYGHRPVALDDEQRTVASSLLLLLRGDAGQRAIAAWSMGWKPAQEASGAWWMAPPLAMLLNDPYDAVRQIAHRSLQALPGFDGWEYDFLAAPAVRTGSTLRVLDHWSRMAASAGRGPSPALLLDASGVPRMEEIVKLGLRRDDRPLVLRE